MLIIGVDPGLKGGVCAMSDTKTLAFSMPVVACGKDNLIDTALIYMKISSAFPTPTDVYVYMEKVHAMPKQGVVSMFNFGRGFGQLIGMCSAFGWEVSYVRPQVWKSSVLPEVNHTKEAAIRFCNTFYPDVSLLATPRSKVPSDGIADAICICHYGKVTATSSQAFKMTRRG